MLTPARAPEPFAVHLLLHEGRTAICVHEGDTDAAAYIDVAHEATSLEFAQAIMAADALGYDVMREVEMHPQTIEELGLNRWWMVPKEN